MEHAQTVYPSLESTKHKTKAEVYNEIAAALREVGAHEPYMTNMANKLSEMAKACAAKANEMERRG